MAQTSLDPFRYLGDLKRAGIPDAQARAQIEATANIVRDYDDATREELATKSELAALREEMNARFRELSKEIQESRDEAQVFRLEINSEVQSVRSGLQEVKNDSQIFKMETRAEFQCVRHELENFKKEVVGEFQSARHEVENFKKEVVGEFQNSRNEMELFKRGIDAKIDTNITEINAKIDILRNDLTAKFDQASVAQEAYAKELASIVQNLRGYVDTVNSNSKNDFLKWVVAILTTYTALIIAVLAGFFAYFKN